MPLNIKPCHLRAARDYVSRYHRHSIPPVGGKFAVACYDGDRLCGIAICGRPVARYLDDGLTLEILRCCTDGTYNACSGQRRRDYYVAPSELKHRWMKRRAGERP